MKVLSLISLISLSIFCTTFLACGSSQTAETPSGFEINPDFQLELVAAEPLVLDPVDLEFDEAGRAYVIEMPGYPLSDEESRLVLLEDKDQDGIYDQRTVFADKLGVASSIMPYRQGILVASPPHLLFLKDTNGDHIADQREILMEGFDVGNLQHNYNGLTYGLDNWIYAATGGNSGAPYFVGHPESKLPLRDQDFRFDIERKILERVGRSSGGFEMALDHWGRMYGTHNTQHISQLVFEEKYFNGMPLGPDGTLVNISNHEENNLARVYPIGEQETRVNHPEQSGYFSGACGITHYGGGAFSEEDKTYIFIADVVLNLIHLDILSHNGIAAEASRHRPKSEFLASTDRAFRPVNMTTGPDGALYLLDMHRDVIEHPEWIPDELERDMDLQAGKDKGRIYRITAKGGKKQEIQNLAGKSISELTEALGDKNQWARMTAQRLLVEKNDPEAISQLETLVENDNNPFAQLHALWTLEGMGKLSDEVLMSALKAKNPDLQIQAI
ncbi:MAG: dehydrogenase, partial [Bacteroidetes bacterium]|nr:dehydrogenase [Bacteroidota bacterium]